MHAFRIFLSLVFLSSGVFADELFEVRMARPVKAGYKSRIAARVAFQSETITKLAGETAEPEKLDAACKLAGELTVVEVTSKGMPKELRFKISEVESFEDGEKAELFDTGDVISIKHGRDKNEITINGEEADETTGEIIQAVFSVAEDEDATIDEGFGSKEKVKVGDEWVGNRAVIAEEMARQGVEGLKPDEIKATTKLVEKTTVNNEAALRFVSDLAFDSGTARVRQLGSDFKTKRVKTTVRSELDYPIDPASLAVHGRSMMNFELESKGDVPDGEGGKSAIEITVKRRAAVDATETPL